MITINFSDADLAALQYWRFHHPDPRVQVRMEALYLRSQGVANRDIPRLCGISKASFHRYLTAYATGGIEGLQHFEPRRPRSLLHQHRPTIEAELRTARRIANVSLIDLRIDRSFNTLGGRLSPFIDWALNGPFVVNTVASG